MCTFSHITFPLLGVPTQRLGMSVCMLVFSMKITVKPVLSGESRDIIGIRKSGILSGLKSLTTPMLLLSLCLPQTLCSDDETKSALSNSKH